MAYITRGFRGQAKIYELSRIECGAYLLCMYVWTDGYGKHQYSTGTSLKVNVPFEL